MRKKQDWSRIVWHPVSDKQVERIAVLWRRCALTCNKSIQSRTLSLSLNLPAQFLAVCNIVTLIQPDIWRTDGGWGGGGVMSCCVY